jgi:hypothetical protein
VGSPFDGTYDGTFDGTVTGFAMPVSVPVSFRVANAQIDGDGFTGQIDANGMATGTAPFASYGLECTYTLLFSAAGTVTSPGTISCTGPSFSASGVLSAHRTA